MQLEVTADSTSPSYWLNWRVFLCASWVLVPMVIASLMIWKYEGFNHLKSDRRENQHDMIRISCNDEAWRPCLKEIHPIWLLAFRVIAFCLLLGTLIVEVVVHGGVIFYYYTQWTFTFLTIYFGCGSLLSLYGCYQYHIISSRGLNVNHVGADMEQEPYVPLTGETTNTFKTRIVSDSKEKHCVSRAACICCYVFEVIFQMNAGAVMLTDSVYWFIIFPYFTVKDYNLNLMTVNMHTLNLALLLGDTALNCLRVPFSRISFFVMWTGVFVIFQWIIHACVSIWWPYPFLDLSSLYAPFWYLLMALMHIPCYGIFALIVKTKLYLLSKWFPLSYQC